MYPNQKILLTGATGGIGREIAQQLDHRGAHIILVDRDAAALEALADDLATSTETYCCDLASRSEVETLCSWIISNHSDLDVLINNAGMIMPGAVIDLPQSVHDTHLDVNLRAPMALIRAVAPLMASRRKGAIVSTVSLGGVIALKESAAYAAAKFGLRGFLCSLHQELHPLGIKVSGIYPAGVDTPMLHYEATHGGSALNFIDKVMSAHDVALAIMRGIDTGKLEIYVPYGASLSSRFAGAFPWVLRPLLPLLEKIGEAGRKKFVARKGLGA